MIKMYAAALKHFESDIQKAAGRLKIVFNSYGNISRKPLNEQTSAVYNILQELQGKYAADVKTVSIEPWVAELQSRNNALSALMKDRYDESALKSDVVLRNGRIRGVLYHNRPNRRVCAIGRSGSVSVIHPRPQYRNR